MNTTTASTGQPLLGPSDEPPVWPITVAMYTEMVYAGILRKEDRVYLGKGRLAPLRPKHRPHCLAVQKTYNALLRLAFAGYTPEQESPMAFRLGPSALEPDVKVIRGRSEDYQRDYPTTADVPLVIEVSETTLGDDRKLAFSYAAEGIPISWLVNLPGNRIEVFSEPAAGAYTRCMPYDRGESVPVVLDGTEVGRLAVDEILP